MQRVIQKGFMSPFNIRTVGILGIPVSSASVKHRLKQSFQAVFFIAPINWGSEMFAYFSGPNSSAKRSLAQRWQSVLTVSLKR